MQGWYIGITAASQAVKAGSTPVPCSKKKDTRTGVFLFGAALLLRKSGRLRAGDGTRVGEPVKGSPLTLPLPCDVRECRQQNLWAIPKRKTSLWVVFLFGMPRAGWNSLPQPARSASNPEVKAGLLRMALPFVGCREASSSLAYFAAQSAKNKEKPPFGRFQSVKKACHCEPVRAAKQVPLGYSSE